MKDGLDIVRADSSTYTIDSIATSDGGAYTCRITNALATELTLYSRPMNVTVDDPMFVADLEDGIPGSPALYQNYPNPFNPQTTITFSLPEAAIVAIRVFNLRGQQVGTLGSGKMPAGTHSVNFDGSRLSSGFYFYTLTANSQSQVRRMNLVR